jgi:hypothetical protein
MTEPRTEAQDVRTDVLELPGATLAYDIRAAEAESGAPRLLMIASPMDASSARKAQGVTNGNAAAGVSGYGHRTNRHPFACRALAAKLTDESRSAGHGSSRTPGSFLLRPAYRGL